MFVPMAHQIENLQDIGIPPGQAFVTGACPKKIQMRKWGMGWVAEFMLCQW